MIRALHGRLLAQWLVVGALLGASAVGAQSARDPRVGLVGSVGVVGIPDAFGPQCGRNGGGGGNGAVDAGVAAIARPWRSVVVQADLRSAAYTLAQGCNLVLFALDTAYASTDRRDPFTTSTVRVGVETPPNVPVLLRLTAGIGRVWGSPARPLTVAGIAVGTRGRVRVLGELDRYGSRADAFEVRTSLTSIRESTRIPIVTRPRWFAGRIGLELPLPAPFSRSD